MPLGAQGEFALVREQLERALRTAGQPVRRGTIAHDHDVYMSLTDTAAHLRDEDAIRTYAPMLVDLAKRDGHRIFEAIAQRASGVAHRLAGEYSEAAECFNQAMRLFEAADHSSSVATDGHGEGVQPEDARSVPAHCYQIARTCVEIAELAVALSDSGRARDYYERALSSFDALGALPDMQNTHAAIERLG